MAQEKMSSFDTTPARAAATGRSATPSTGNSGSVGELSNSDNTLRDMDNQPTA
jgi:hypothetical protein